MELERLLVAEEVAEMLRVSKDRVYELVRTGQIPHLRMGRQVRFSEQVLRDWISRGGRVS